MIRIVGDVHGKIPDYINLVKDCPYSIQVGDLGFDYKGLRFLDRYKHMFFPGNHDNYDTCYDLPHCLGDAGNFELDDIEFFFIRGGFSIDYLARVKFEQQRGFKTWWTEEQLTTEEMEWAYDDYVDCRPSIMLSHSCPKEISDIIGNPGVLKAFGFNPDVFSTRTQELLQACFEVHKPDIWIFGHFHQNVDFIYNDTRFICLDELCYLDIVDGKIINKNKIRKVL